MDDAQWNKLVGSLRYYALMTVLVLILAGVFFVGWFGDRRSCERQIAPRVALRDFLHSDADFQRGLRRFDQVPGNKTPRRWVTIDGRRHFWTATDLRSWVSAQWQGFGDTLPVPDCGGLVPPTN